MNKEKLNFVFWAMSPVGGGISGGDRIFIELARNFSKKGIWIKIITWNDGLKMCKRNGLVKNSTLSFEKLSISRILTTNFLAGYLARIFLAKLWAMKQTKKNMNKIAFFYSVSDFWMDVFPAVILKLRNRKIKWIAAWYQTAPSPIRGFTEGKRERRYRLSAFIYWASQFISKPLIKRFADFILVNNEDEKKQFTVLNKKGRVLVVLGAVNLDEIKNWKLKIGNLLKVYDAVFQGRFHPQKGVVELIDIWGKVVDKKPDAKLVMIGDGSLMKNVKRKIKDLRLEKNIILRGYLFDGKEKYKIFAQSKIVVHPALYDSGGMAAGEAMAFGLPCVGFNLKSYESYYPKGMLKVKIGDLNAFADIIVKLLDDKIYQKKIGQEAEGMIEESWGWEKRAEEILRIIDKN